MTTTLPALGAVRRLSRMADRSGFLRVAAIDHPENCLALFDHELSRVTFDEVVESKLALVAAAAAGAGGSMAGRAIWGDAVGRHDEATRRAGAKTACERLEVLGEIVTTWGRPVRVPPSLSETMDTLGPDWHREYRR